MLRRENKTYQRRGKPEETSLRFNWLVRLASEDW